MSALIARYLDVADYPRVDEGKPSVDLIVFLATTGLCALGALTLPLVG